MTKSQSTQLCASCIQFLTKTVKKRYYLAVKTPFPDQEKMSDTVDKAFEKIKSILKSLPQTSGVYKMKDEEGKVIYVGKAKNLRSRVAQYFGAGKDHSIKTKKMVEKICDIEIVETSTEFEALILETNLIKELRPRYNVLMRDDKNYVYIKVTTQEDYPRLSIVRKREKNDGAIYFGPKTSADACEKLIDLLRKIFPVRTCSLEMEDGKDGLINITKKTIPVPCLDYHIKRCRAPCINLIKKEEYGELIKQIVKFLKGSYQELLTRLKYQMFAAAKESKFEQAAKIRDQIKGIEQVFLKQVVSDPAFFDRDVIGVFPDFDKTFITLLQFREGKMISQENFTLESPTAMLALSLSNGSTGSDSESTSSVIESFLRSYYSETSDIPSEIFLRDLPEDAGLWEQWLTNERQEENRKKVHLLTAERGAKNRILELAEKNAASFAKQSRVKWMSDAAKTTQAARDLADELGLEKDLTRIECYDISHLGGEDQTASMVVFVKGSPETKLYRHFKLKTLENGEIDDYKAMEEVLTRRLQRLTQFATPKTKNYVFKKPLKKDFEIIQKTLSSPSSANLPPSQGGTEGGPEREVLRAVYFDSKLVGYSQLTFHNEGKSGLFSSTWLEGEHDTRALRHQLWRSLLEKIKLPHVYAVCLPEEKENFLSFGFTELKKVPEFLNQQPATSNQPTSYLVYKITKKSPDDSFSQVPDLIIVDGGKGQLSSAMKAVNASGLEIPTVGLAKQEEEIFTPERRILLPRNSQALYLVQRIRDESHRFANELRKKLGAKKLTESDIDSIPGIGTILKRRLLKEYGSINAIKAAPISQLEKSVGSFLAKRLKKQLGKS